MTAHDLRKRAAQVAAAADALSGSVQEYLRKKAAVLRAAADDEDQKNGKKNRSAD